MILDTTTRSLEVFYETAKTTTEPDFAAFWADTQSGSTFVPGQTNGATNGNTAVTLAGAPGSATQRQVKEVLIYNADTVSHNFTVRVNDGGTYRILGIFTVPTLQTLFYSPEHGWAVGPSTTVAATENASYQNVVSAPTAPASTSAYAMQGLAGGVTPSNSGRVLLLVSGTIVSPVGTTAGLGIDLQLSYGTGSAPANAAAITGTQVGAVMAYTNAGTVTAVDVNVPFSIHAVVSSLTVATSYWFDLAAKSLGTASDMGIANISLSAVEF